MAKTKPNLPCLFLLLAFCVRGSVSAQSYTVDWHTIEAGGTGAGGGYALAGAFGQPYGSAAQSGGGYTLESGFRGLLSASLAGSVTIFNNSAGSESNGIRVDTTTWLAAKFCPGSRSWQLDSLSLMLSNGTFDGQPTGSSLVRLRIYANDPVTGKPSSSTGVIMDLQDQPNPFPVGYLKLYRWTSATPFTLSANTCYWAVFSIESGAAVGLIPSFAMPTGDAGVFGAARSINAGATWGTPETAYNFKMLIKGTALPPPPPSPIPRLVADGTTAIPGGTGNFTGLPGAPGLDGDHMVFYGEGAGGQQGLYLSNRLTPGGPPVKLADRATAIPGGTGTFQTFGAEVGIIIVSGNTAVFPGTGAGGQKGIYGASVSAVGPPQRFADLTTAIPGGSGNFTDFPGGPGLSGDRVVFVGSGAGGQQGIYGASVSTAGPPEMFADTATAIPGGTGNFQTFGAEVGIIIVSGNTAVFPGSGAGGQRGIYGVDVSTAGPPQRFADLTTAIPGGSGNFTDFPGGLGLSGDRVVFAGSGAGGQQGIYGASVSLDGPPQKFADTATSIPGGSGNFTEFGAVSVSATDVAFLGKGAGGQTGIYDLTGGQLLKVIAVGEAIGGKTIAGLQFSRGGLWGDPIAFQATFTDGSQGVYSVDVPVPPFEFKVTGVEWAGNDLLLSFPSLAGSDYAVQSSIALDPGTWTTLPGPALSGTGSIVRLTVSDAFAGPRQFYRVVQLP